jgi:hypothetical protein
MGSAEAPRRRLSRFFRTLDYNSSAPEKVTGKHSASSSPPVPQRWGSGLETTHARPPPICSCPLSLPTGPAPVGARFGNYPRVRPPFCHPSRSSSLSLPTGPVPMGARFGNYPRVPSPICHPSLSRAASAGARPVAADAESKQKADSPIAPGTKNRERLCTCCIPQPILA